MEEIEKVVKKLPSLKTPDPDGVAGEFVLFLFKYSWYTAFY